MGKMITLDDAAERLAMSKRAVRRLISSGELPAFRIGKGSVRVREEDLDMVCRPITPSGKDW